MRRIFLFCLIILLFSFCLPIQTGFVSFWLDSAQAAGATLFLSPSSGTYTINKNFTVKVMVDSGGGVGINAAEGIINYDSSHLIVSRVSDSGSIFKLWTAEPTYSNTEGKVTFGGGTPGAYTGNAGTIFSVTFTAKKIGETQVSFSSGIVLAADGKGTNVFSGFGQAKYTIVEAGKRETKPKEEAKEKAKGILPPIPEIYSLTHPDEDIWYAENEPEFSWKILSDLTGLSYVITEEATTDPSLYPESIIETKKFEKQEDGIWYFHIKYQNRYGWGQAAHRKFQVDATPPESFIVIVDNEGDPTNPTPKLGFKTEDKTSGLSHYQIIIGEEIKAVSLEEVAGGYYQLSLLKPGDYSVTVVAVDKAQNSASSSANFVVDPLKVPIIASIPKIIDKKDDLIIQGTSFYPQVNVKIYIGKNNKEAEEFSVKTDDEGNWMYFYQGSLTKGNYEIWAKIIDSRGAESLPSTKHLLTVISPSIVELYGWLIIIILLIIILFLILYIIYQHKRFNEEKVRIKSETEEVKDKLRKIFSALREEVDELIELADKKPGLSETERRVKEKLQESLDISEEFISKEVEDVEKEIKLKKKESV